MVNLKRQEIKLHSTLKKLVLIILHSLISSYLIRKKLLLMSHCLFHKPTLKVLFIFIFQKPHRHHRHKNQHYNTYEAKKSPKISA